MSTIEAPPRKAVIDTLAKADPSVLADLWARLGVTPSYRLVRGPETGLVMIRGRAGGGGAPFNLGEASVTRATIRLETGEVGHAYALGRDGEKAVRSALLDALWQREPERIEAEVLVPLRQKAVEAATRLREETAATRVNFFTMVRGDD